MPEKQCEKDDLLEFFPVPVISQAGGPEELISSEQANKKDTSQSGWNLNFWFRSVKETKRFQLPDARGPLLDSFEEMLSVNPVIEVRLHDGANRRQKGNQRLAFQNAFARLQNQEALTDQSSGALYLTDGDIVSDSCIGCQSRSSGRTNEARRQRIGTLSDRPMRRVRMASPESSSLQNRSAFGLMQAGHRAKSDIQVSPRRRAWFGGLGWRQSEGQNLKKRSTVEALRTHSMPPDVEKSGIQHLGQNTRSALSGRSDPVAEFWNEYWSITEQSLTAELTLAEKVSQASNKREAVQAARAAKSRNASRPSVEKLTAVNVFLDDLLDQYLGKPTSTPSNQPCPSPRTAEDVLAPQLEAGTVPQTALDLRSNINELLFCSASGPGDRTLEKWFLADKKAEADYYRFDLPASML